MKLFQIRLAMIAISCVGMRAAETGPRSCPRLPSLAPEEKLQLQTDGKAFMVRLSMGEYESAFSELFAKYAEPGRSAEADARKWTYDMGYLSEELQARCGDAIPGSFTFVGSLTAGGRILNLAYLLRHAWRPFPVVLDFSKIEDRWAMVQISTDPELSMEVMREFWTTVDPAYLTQEVERVDLAAAVLEVKDKLFHCSVCNSITDVEPCRFCTDPQRDTARICVVEEPYNIQPIERTGEFRGRYHVLMGALSPQRGIGPP